MAFASSLHKVIINSTSQTCIFLLLQICWNTSFRSLTLQVCIIHVRKRRQHTCTYIT